MENDIMNLIPQDLEIKTLHQVPVNHECHFSKNRNILLPSYEASLKDTSI